MGRTSLADARERFQELGEQWHVRLHQVTETRSSIIGFGTRKDLPVVLKSVIGLHEEWDAGAVVAAYSGCGMVRAHEHVPGAVLLEEVRPGTPLADLVQRGRDEEATGIMVGVIKAMSKAAPEVGDRPVAADWAAGFDGYLAGGGDAIPTALVRSARMVYRELSQTQRDVRLLHGDLHHHNVLFDQDRGWLAIDPKGVVAEPEFELGAVLRNPQGMPELHIPSVVRRRVQQLSRGLEVDPGRVIGWTFAQAVLCAVWTLEDARPPRDTEPFLRVARAARGLMG